MQAAHSDTPTRARAHPKMTTQARTATGAPKRSLSIRSHAMSRARTCARKHTCAHACALRKP
eukprot:6214814-Pleurochrysis_carterae.AAC.2